MNCSTTKRNMGSLYFKFFTIFGAASVVPVLAFPSNIHTQMNSEEIFETFGTNDLVVPRYEVISLRLGEHEFGANNLEISIKAFHKWYNLKLNRTEGLSVTKYTPIWSASSDSKAFKGIRYDPLKHAIKDLGEFAMYHDYKNKAAITIFNDPDEGNIAEGIVAGSIGIKYLPKRLALEIAKHDRHRNSVKDQKNTSYYAVFKIPSIKKNVILSSSLIDMFKSKRSLRDNYKKPETIYPKYLVVLDHNVIRNRKMTGAFRYALALWNAVDLVYSVLESPKVQLSIAGIVIAADDEATPYIAETTKVQAVGPAEQVLTQTWIYFAEDGILRINPVYFDMIVVMTPLKLCRGDNIDKCDPIQGISHFKIACGFIATAVVHYNFKFGSILSTSQVLAHLMGVSNDMENCSEEPGFIMSHSVTINQQIPMWSNCSLKILRDYVSAPYNFCLPKKSIWTKSFPEVLPGKSLTIDGQCRNLGLPFGCTVNPRNPKCVNLGCKETQTGECIEQDTLILPGSKCALNKHCRNQTCVKDVYID